MLTLANPMRICHPPLFFLGLLAGSSHSTLKPILNLFLLGTALTLQYRETGPHKQHLALDVAILPFAGPWTMSCIGDPNVSNTTG